jgi:hypothetical protein
MKIFIDDQYKTIYDGEFTHWIEDSVINPLKEKFDVYVAKSSDETKTKLTIEVYDLVIITGYDIEPLTYVDRKKSPDTKYFCIIYEMNAERLVSVFGENVEDKLSDIITLKSRLIFLCSGIIVPSKTVKEQISNLYAGYKREGLDISKKIIDQELVYKNHYQAKSKQFDYDYVFINNSINGASILLDDFSKIIFDFCGRSDGLITNIKVLINANNIPSNLVSKIGNAGLKDKFILLDECDQEDIYNLSYHSICNFFISSFDENPYQIINACESKKSITFLNSFNDFYASEFSTLDTVYYDPSMNFVDLINDVLNINKESRSEIIKNNKKIIEEYSNHNSKELIKAVERVFID